MSREADRNGQLVDATTLTGFARALPDRTLRLSISRDTSDHLVAIGNVEIVRGQIRLLADRVEINRDTGRAVAQGKVCSTTGPTCPSS